MQSARYSGGQNTTPSSFEQSFTIASMSACDVVRRWIRASLYVLENGK